MFKTYLFLIDGRINTLINNTKIYQNDFIKFYFDNMVMTLE